MTSPMSASESNPEQSTFQRQWNPPEIAAPLVLCKYKCTHRDRKLLHLLFFEVSILATPTGHRLREEWKWTPTIWRKQAWNGWLSRRPIVKVGQFRPSRTLASLSKPKYHLLGRHQQAHGSCHPPQQAEFQICQNQLPSSPPMLLCKLPSSTSASRILSNWIHRSSAFHS